MPTFCEMIINFHDSFAFLYIFSILVVCMFLGGEISIRVMDFLEDFVLALAASLGMLISA